MSTNNPEINNAAQSISFLIKVTVNDVIDVVIFLWL